MGKMKHFINKITEWNQPFPRLRLDPNFKSHKFRHFEIDFLKLSTQQALNFEKKRLLLKNKLWLKR
jgi:hypothetical protein